MCETENPIRFLVETFDDGSQLLTLFCDVVPLVCTVRLTAVQARSLSLLLGGEVGYVDAPMSEESRRRFEAAAAHNTEQLNSLTTTPPG